MIQGVHLAEFRILAARLLAQTGRYINNVCKNLLFDNGRRRDYNVVSIFPELKFEIRDHGGE